MTPPNSRPSIAGVRGHGAETAVEIPIATHPSNGAAGFTILYRIQTGAMITDTSPLICVQCITRLAALSNESRRYTVQRLSHISRSPGYQRWRRVNFS